MTKIFSESFLEEAREFYLGDKTLVWGMILPIIATLLFQSVNAGIAVALVAVVMFLKNGKFKEAWQVVGYLIATIAIAIGAIFIIAASAIF